MIQGRSTWRTGGLAGVLGLMIAVSAPAQKPVAVQSFPAEVLAITVDVLVLDKDGRPVRNLTKDDFTVLEDGRTQTIVGFEPRDVAAAAATTSEPQSLPVVATNEAASTAPGRVLALVIDDLGISAVTASQLKPALENWIRTRAEPRDEMTIMTTSGDLWWSDTVARGREDLLAVLARVKGKKLAEPRSSGGMSAWEAYQIAAVQPDQDPQFTLSDGVPKFSGYSMMDRLLQLWFDQHLCTCPPMSDCQSEVRGCANQIRVAANDAHQRWSLRAQATLATLGNLSRSLSSIKGRKAILLVSEEFLEDNSLGSSTRDAIAALQRGNAAVYFLGALGLTGNSTFSVTQDRMPRPQDIMNIGIEQTTLAIAGAVALAEATGGTAITSSNDLASGLDRMALDASAYYLLGYQPEKPPDGKWHDLEVKVNRPGVKVRARRRYLAARPEDLARTAEVQKVRRPEQGKDKDEKLSKRPLSPSILTGSARGSLPLRLAAYVQDTNQVGQARVQIVVEIDNSRAQVDRTSTPWHGELDLTVLVAGLGRAPIVPLDERMKLSLEAKDVDNGWWLLQREVWLPPGVAQVRVFARDVLSKAEGVVTERLVVPDVDAPYLSTPIITDRTLPPLKPGEPSRLVPTARRSFGRQRPLFCQYEVFAFGGLALAGVPQLAASYTLQRPEGQVVSSGALTPIETNGYRAVRRITLPAAQLEEGPYQLEVHVEDRLAQRALNTRAAFVIEGGKAASVSEPSAPQ